MNDEEYVRRYVEAGYPEVEVRRALAESGLNNSSGVDARSFASNTMFAGGYGQDNLIKWQLEMDSNLERMEHLLRGDTPTFVDGNMVYLPPKNESEKILNEYGVKEFMRIMSNYLNRNTILSNYDQLTINEKMLDFGNEVNDLIYTTSEKIGLDTDYKKKKFSILVREMVDTVHSAYQRALFGGERDSLRSARSIQQSENLAPAGMYAPQMQQKRSLWNPLSWFGGGGRR